MANQLILIRHGDLGDRCRGRYIGRTDAALSAEGRRQAAALARPLARLHGALFLASPLHRTRETAGIALAAGGAAESTPPPRAVQTGSDAGRAMTGARGGCAEKAGTPAPEKAPGGCGETRPGSVLEAGGRFEIDANLREIDFGRWEGMSFAEIAAADPAAVDRWAAWDPGFAFPGGEGIANFRKRIRAAANRVIAEPAGTVVLFAHGGVIRFLICRILGLPDRHHLLFDIGPASISEIRIEGGKGVLARLNDRHHLGGC